LDDGVGVGVKDGVGVILGVDVGVKLILGVILIVGVILGVADGLIIGATFRSCLMGPNNSIGFGIEYTFSAICLLRMY
jgi:hypothetical protein